MIAADAMMRRLLAASAADRAAIESLTSAVAVLQAQVGGGPHPAELLRALACEFPTREFSAGEAIDRARANPQGVLAAILAELDAFSGQKLGWKLTNLKGQIHGIYRLERLGTDRYGAIWRIHREGDLRVLSPKPAVVID